LDDVAGITEEMRTKEHAHDYRYFPEPDLMPMAPTDEWLAEVKSRVVELPLARKQRFMRDYQLPAPDAETFKNRPECRVRHLANRMDGNPAFAAGRRRSHAGGDAARDRRGMAAGAARFLGKAAVDALIHLPLVLPPVVTGYLLLLTFGRRGLVGAWLADHLGIVFAFRWTGAALACGIMSFPLLVRRSACRSKPSTGGWSRPPARWVLLPGGCLHR